MKLPWVSRAIYASYREVAAARVGDYERTINMLNHRIEAVEARAQAAEDRAIRVLSEARLMMSDAFALSRTAANAIFGQQTPAEIENPPSVREADAAAARKRREQEATRR